MAGLVIQGAQGLTPDALREELRAGGRVVAFTRVISLGVVTLTDRTLHLVRAGEGTFGHALPATLTTLVMGWWGFPWGLIRTPIALVENLSGGKDLTPELLASLEAAARAPAPRTAPTPALEGG